MVNGVLSVQADSSQTQKASQLRRLAVGVGMQTGKGLRTVSSPPATPASKPKRRIVCRYCGINGHMKAACHKRMFDEKAMLIAKRRQEPHDSGIADPSSETESRCSTPSPAKSELHPRFLRNWSRDPSHRRQSRHPRPPDPWEECRLQESSM